MIFEIGFGLLCGSLLTSLHSLPFSRSFKRSRQFVAACKTLNLSVTYGADVALPTVNAEYKHPWGERYLVNLPAGLSSAKVIDQQRALAEALRVNTDDMEMRYDNGLIVDIITAKMPTKVVYISIVEDVPQREYRVLVGVNRRGEQRYYDFDGPYAHLLIAGISGGGKSVLLRAILTQLATRPAPDMYLCDLKGGVELGIYRDLACVAGFATTLPEVRNAAAAVESEMIRRYESMAASGSQQWSGKKAVFVVDELADFKTRAGDPEAKLKNEIKSIITRLSAKGRAAGVLLVLATQRPSADIVDGLIKTNIAASICFRTRDGTQSRIVLDHDGAAALPDVPGRLIYQTAHDETLQAPYLTAEDAKRLIAELPRKRLDIESIENEEESRHVVDDKPHASETSPLDSDITFL
jgi:S-DNA-T family DNA segregation ATPase FtsK/SpoIIIE